MENYILQNLPVSFNVIALIALLIKISVMSNDIKWIKQSLKSEGANYDTEKSRKTGSIITRF